MINIYHGQACWRLLKHNTNKIEALLLEDKQQEHNAPQLLVPQVTET